MLFPHNGKHEMCHRIGHFSSRNPRVEAVLEVLRFNRRSLYNGARFDTLFSEVLAKSGARGRGSEKELSEKHQKTAVFHLFQDPALSEIQGPGVGAWERSGRIVTEPGKVSSRTPFLTSYPVIHGFSHDFSSKRIVVFIPIFSVP